MVLFTKPPELKTLEEGVEAIDAPVIVGILLDEEGKPRISEALRRLDKALGAGIAEDLEARGKLDKGEVSEYRVRGRLILVTAIPREDGEQVRRAYARAVKRVHQKYERAVLITEGLSDELALEAVIGAALGAYVFDALRSERKRKLSEILVDRDPGLERARAIVEGVYLARDAANAPPNHLYPEKLAEHVKRIMEPLGVDVEIFDYNRLVKDGFGGIVNVGKGSSRKPVLIIMRYRGAEKPPLALVGKTIVFDSGGMNLKSSYSLFEMRHDKAGGAGVLGAVYIIAKLRLPINLVALLPAAINVPGGESYLPSDVIRMWDGTWVEVGNTDAEGRLVLADAIAYAAKEIGAETIITMATLTGSALAALGPLLAAAFTRDDDLLAKIREASRRSGEKVWPLPLEDDYKPVLAKSAKIGDVSNIAMRWGDAIYAALFLEKFSHGKRFLHIDMAGPGMGTTRPVPPPDYWPSGAPGWGARLLYELAKLIVNG